MKKKLTWSTILTAIAGTAIAIATRGGSKPAPPASPPMHSLTVHVVMGNGTPVPQPLQLRIADLAPNPNAGGHWTTNENGDIGLTLTQAGFTVCADAPSAAYQGACTGVTLTSDQTITLTLARITPPVEPVHLEGVRLVTAS